ncbi:MAG TPA: hypothetical protein VGL42_02745 [Opitutaceae bacterium]|jgi:hypothetical protein
MKTSRFAALLTLSLGVAAVSVQADTFDYSYTFNDGVVATGSFAGSLSGNLVTNISNATVFENGVQQPGPMFIESFDAGASHYVDSGAVASLNGLQNNLLFINVDLAAGDVNETAFFGSVTDPAVLNVISSSSIAQVGDAPIDEEQPANSSWTLTDVSRAPDAASAFALLGMGLAGLGAVRRRFSK